MRRWSRAAAAALASFACAAHVQQPGEYAFAIEELLIDDCAILSSGTLWGGRLDVFGETVQFQYGEDLFNARLDGQYREASESFFLDGTVANVSGAAGGAPCEFELVTFHMEGESSSATEFTGTLKVRYDDHQEPRCRCEIGATFRAQYSGP